jgi:Flp pilus assembly CpaE family ATPase
MMTMSLLDYEMLARQKRDALLEEAKRLRLEAEQARANQGRQGAFRAFLGAFRARLGGAGRATVATRAA